MVITALWLIFNCPSELLYYFKSGLIVWPFTRYIRMLINYPSFIDPCFIKKIPESQKPKWWCYLHKTVSRSTFILWKHDKCFQQYTKHGPNNALKQVQMACLHCYRKCHVYCIPRSANCFSWRRFVSDLSYLDVSSANWLRRSSLVSIVHVTGASPAAFATVVAGGVWYHMDAYR